MYIFKYRYKINIVRVHICLLSVCLKMCSGL